jgi:hypothetical protein
MNRHSASNPALAAALRFILVLFILILFVFPCLVSAQMEQPPFNLGPFQSQGSITAGYRLDSISGYRPGFQQMFDLQSGFRIFDFNFSGKASENLSLPVDDFQLTASGLGGDPFPGGQLTVSKANLYDLRVNYRQDYYYWNQNDNAILPISTPGLTSNHNWATVRRFGSLNLLLHATNNLRFHFEYDRNGRDGTVFTTRVLDYYGAPASWGTFLRDNPYYVIGPVSDNTNRIAGGVDYTIRDWNIHYTVGYQTFNSSMSWTNPAVERSINLASTANVKELLANGNWSEVRRLNAPTSELFFNGKVSSRLTWRGDFLYFRYSGPSTIDASYQGKTRQNTSGSIVTPYAVSLSSSANDTEPNYVLDQGFTYKLTNWWNFDADYRLNRFTETGGATFFGANGTLSSTGTTVQRWTDSTNQLDLRMEFNPINGLVVSPGIRLLKRDVETLADGVIDQGRTLRTKTAWPIGSFFYQPVKNFSIRGDFQSITNNTSYTRITPHTDIGTRLIFRYRLGRFSLEDSLAIRSQKLIATHFKGTMRANSATLAYAFKERLSGFAGFSYDSLFATDSVTFIRGTAPLNTTWRDQIVNRVWQLGINAEPVRRLGLAFSGNFVRTTGLGEITGELPRFGPLTFPMATATIRYDVPRIGRIALDLQRSYYSEQIVTGNNFSADLLTVRWTIPFAKTF